MRAYLIDLLEVREAIAVHVGSGSLCFEVLLRPRAAPPVRGGGSALSQAAEKKLPRVLSESEVRRLLEAAEDLQRAGDLDDACIRRACV